MKRRKFLGNLTCAAVGSSTVVSAINSLNLINAATLDNLFLGGDYKALVCVLLSGGNDSFNMLIPHGLSEYNNYANTRGNLAVSREDLLALNGTQHAVHPGMAPIKKLFDDGDLSFITNIGTLVGPTTINDINDSNKVPLGLFSHRDQVIQWQTGIPTSRDTIGWGGKIADLLHTLNEDSAVSMNISLDGTNIFQSGNMSTALSYDASGDNGLEDFDIETGDNFLRNYTRHILDANHNDIFKQTYADVIVSSDDIYEHIEPILSGAEDFTRFFTGFTDVESNLTFRKKMARIAQMISVREDFNTKRQIFFVEYGGWDHHDGFEDFGIMVQDIADGLSGLNDALTYLELQDCVTTFTMSEFGRTLTSNGNGSDHAWGGNVMVMGGQVNGGQIYGTYPSLDLNTFPDDLRRGILIPGLSTDQYFAELALWFGVSPAELVTLFPNIGNFYSTSSGMMPIGFLEA